MIKTIQRLDIDGNPTTLATFTMSAGRLTAEYHSKSLQRQLVTDGVYAQGRQLFPMDGQAFFDGLDKEFANSSTIRVVSSGQRADFDDSEARGPDGKWTGGGDSGSAKASVAEGEHHASVLKTAAEAHDHPDVKAAAEKAAALVVKAKEAAKAGDHAQAKKYAEGAKHEHDKLAEHAKHKADEHEEEKHEGGGKNWWLDLLRLLGLKRPG